MPVRVLVVDDSALFRKAVKDALADSPGIEVAGVAANGKIALALLDQLKPDMLTLDIEMPEMDGIEVLKALQKQKRPVGTIVLSALTEKGSVLTLKALELGAFHFITKPSGGGSEQSLMAIRSALVPLIHAYAKKAEGVEPLKGERGSPVAAASGAPQTKAMPANTPPAAPPDNGPAQPKRVPAGKPELVLIGVSTGGPNALTRMLPEIPSNLGVPILIVQHMPPLFTKCLAESLSSKCSIRVKEGEDGEILEPNIAYLAPGGKQMRVAAGLGGRKLIQLTEDPPENGCKPAVDYLFRSVAHHFPGKATAVIMTGMGNDGTLGLKLLKRHGALSIAQDERTCVVFGMPKEAIQAGVIDRVVPLESIALEICNAVKGIRV